VIHEMETLRCNQTSLNLPPWAKNRRRFNSG
jgi:hypothetical protein